VERAMGERFVSRPRVVALEPNTLEDIWADMRRVGEACAVLPRAETLIREIQQQLHQIAARVQTLKRVAVIEWIEPLMHAGHWTPQLVALAGAQPVLWNEAPDAIVVAPCGFDIPRTRAEMHWLTQRPEWRTIQAPVFLADGNQFFNRPGPRILDTVRILAAAAHPHLFPLHHGMERFQ
jgi:iron complex transport system substrate-binding protein